MTTSDEDGTITRRAWMRAAVVTGASLALAGCARTMASRRHTARGEEEVSMSYDVVVVGGGPAGLSAALILGRARKRVLLCDAGAPRNAAAEHMQGFVSRDGTPPPELRRIARAELAAYPSVEVRDVRVRAVRGERGAFEVEAGEEIVSARRVLFAVGMVDEPPALPGVPAAWGHSVLLCPYCHGWEVRDGAFAFWAPSADALDFALLLRGWTADVVVLTNGDFAVPDEARARLDAARVRIDERRIERLVTREGDARALEAIVLADGERLPRDVLFVRTPQRPTALVRESGVALDPAGYVRVSDAMETSRPGLYAAGDLTTSVQGALLSAAAGARAAYALNRELTVERVLAGAPVPEAEADATRATPAASARAPAGTSG